MKSSAKRCLSATFEEDVITAYDARTMSGKADNFSYRQRMSGIRGWLFPLLQGKKSF